MIVLVGETLLWDYISIYKELPHISVLPRRCHPLGSNCIFRRPRPLVSSFSLVHSRAEGNYLFCNDISMVHATKNFYCTPENLQNSNQQSISFKVQSLKPITFQTPQQSVWKPAILYHLSTLHRSRPVSIFHLFLNVPNFVFTTKFQ